MSIATSVFLTIITALGYDQKLQAGLIKDIQKNDLYKKLLNKQVL